MHFFVLVLGGGKINRPGQLAPMGEDNQDGVKISQDIFSLGGASCPGGKINWDTCYRCC